MSLPPQPSAAPTVTAIPLSDPALAARLMERMEAVERALADAVASADRLADDVSHHLVAAGGKRLRPFLTLLTGELGDGTRPELLDAAVVVELTHLASLYHDDVMDSAPLRRGAPSVHSVWGNTVAILVGDLLFARASARVAGLGPDAVRLQAETFERLCLGQLHETTGPGEDEDPVEHYLQVLADKTASLLSTSARFGAMFGGAPQAAVETVAAYGEKVGVAFQLADDVLDLASSGAESGKTPGTDLREGIGTMPVLLLRQRAARGVASQDDLALLAALDGDLSSDAALADVVGRLRAHDVLRETRDLAVRYAREAAAELAPLPAGPVREALEAFASALADRAA
ncbi:polyprenyl synthetase family protein [Xylanimonas allomyrinae]|uniref:Polyprenyl synthetase family protein n=1 Tax=Xylanimonas allomyrinae TaxID=2509459 RepID=A0A4P6EN89_9MICO|nr:polyprenyl synthetase family protein [Xylanimonas allomyrinae]QAY64360.1 polyprenyl synthetase family protein [Xylanimonas allomyrinae]